MKKIFVTISLGKLMSAIVGGTAIGTILAIILNFSVTRSNQEVVAEQTDPLTHLSEKALHDLRTTGRVNRETAKNLKDEILTQAETLEKSGTRQDKIALIEKVEAIRLAFIVEPKLHQVSQMDPIETEFDQLMEDLK